MKQISHLTSTYKIKKPIGKGKERYIEVCEKIAPYFGSLVWTLPYKVGFTDSRILEAARACWRQKKVGPQYFRYLYKVILNSQIR